MSAVTLPLLNVKSNEQNLIRDVASIGVGVSTLENRCEGLEFLLRTIESECMSHFSRLNKLDSFCSSGTRNQTGEAVATHLHSIVEIVKNLEYTSSSFATSVGQTSAMRPTFSDSNPLPPTSSLVDSKLASFSVELDLVRSAILDLTSRIGQDAVDVWGVHFHSLSQTTALARNELPSIA